MVSLTLWQSYKLSYKQDSLGYGQAEEARMFAAVAIVVLLVVLLAPSWVALYLRRMTFGQAMEAAWRVWIAQVITSIVLIILADRLGFLNPAGYTLGICLLVGFAGALFLRRKLKST